jgi:hypothetical protein
MKKAIIGLSLAVGLSSVYAADVGISVGRDQNSKQEVAALSIGTTMHAFRLEAEVSRTVDTSTSIGASVGRELKLGSFSLTPHIGAAYIEAESSSVKSGSVVTSGLSASYALTKHVSVAVDLTRLWDVSNSTNFQGNVVTAGLRTSF